MKVIPLLILGILVAVCLSSFSSALFFRVQESYVVTPNSATDTSDPSFWRGQSVRVGAVGLNQDFTLSMITLWFNATDAGANYTILIQNNTGATVTPNGQNISRGSILGAAINSSTLRPYNITMSPALLYARTNYTIIVFSNRTTSAMDLGPWILTPGTYNAGNLSNSIDSGGTWSTGPNDMPFIMYSGENSALNVTSFWNATGFETSSQGFSANLTLSPAYNISSASLVYDGTSYSATASKVSTLNYTLSSSLQLPTSPGPKEWYWLLTFANGTQYSTQGYYQNILSINLSICGAAPQNIPYINITFRNETTAQELVTANIVATGSYSLGSMSVNKSFSYSNSNFNPSYAFCFTPQSIGVNFAPNIVYDNPYSQQRTYNPTALALTNSTTARTLFLLPDSDGTFVTYQVVNSALQAISGVLITITSSTFGDISQSFTSDAGSATFFLNPNSVYTVCASKAGYPTFCTTDTFQTSPYTITLGSNSTNVPRDYSRGVSYSIQPFPFYLGNNTNYLFNFTFNSSYWTATSFGFTLTNSSGFLIASDTQSGTVGIASVTASTGNHTSVVMNAFWIVNGTYVNVTRIWSIVNTGDTDFSIAHLFSRLLGYVNDPNDADGLFGLKNDSDNNFSLSIIVFFIIFGGAGFVSLKYGIDNPPTILMFMFALTWLFDVSLGMIPRPSTGVPLATVIVAAILLFFGLREVTR